MRRTPTTSSIRLFLLGVAALALVSGCGTSDDRSQARAVVGQFREAVEAGRGEDACTRLSDALVGQIESEAGDDCRNAVKELDLGRGEAVDANVFGVNAVVELDDGQRDFLGREPDGWRLSALGCKREPSRPTDAPLTCEAEG